MKISANSKIVMIGDSITDAGRSRPAGEGLGDALGHGYVTLINALLGAACPEECIRVVNKGNSGDTVRSLKLRWQEDVLDPQPDWVSIMIGTNDVWRQFDSPLQVEDHVEIDEYAATLEELIKVTLPVVSGVVLMTPFYIEPNRDDAMRAQMDRYGEVVRSLAARYGTQFVDTQAAFDSVLKTYYPATLGWDRVHPSVTGHMVIARAFLNEIGFKW